jgi:hypothetical protein
MAQSSTLGIGQFHHAHGPPRATHEAEPAGAKEVCMEPIPLHIRERIIRFYDEGEATLEISDRTGYCSAARSRRALYENEKCSSPDISSISADFL